jgi:acyl dehydratase
MTPGAGHMRTRPFGEVEVGEELPDETIEVTTALVVAGAIASRDFQDVHHDRAAAQAGGAKDVFMNIFTTQGLIGRYVSDWAGPEALFQRMSIRLGVPNYPGDVMRLTGRVASAEASGSEGVVAVEVRGTNGLGDHVTGTITLTLPVAAS